MAFVVNHNHPKDKALAMVKKALAGKFAIVKDEGLILKAGAPMHPVTIEIAEGTITVSGGAMAKMFIDPIGLEIKSYFDEHQDEGGAAPAADAAPQASGGAAPKGAGYTLQEYFDYQEKGISIIKSYKELLDSDIITKEEFDEKKAEILNFIKGIMNA